MASRGRWQSDATLIRACRAGDQSAWGRLIERYRRLVYSVPVAYRLAPADADEIFQRVALKLFENLARLRRAESLPAWLSVTTRRECKAFVRAGGRWEALEDANPRDLSEDPPDVAAALDAVHSEHALSLAFERLDESCRRLLSALYLEDPAPSYEQISSRLGRPVGSLGPTRARCLAKLRKLFLGMGGEAP